MPTFSRLVRSFLLCVLLAVASICGYMRVGLTPVASESRSNADGAVAVVADCKEGEGESAEASDQSPAAGAASTSIPNPFTQQALEALYDPKGLSMMGIALDFDELRQTWEGSALAVERYAAACGNRRAFRRLQKEGMRVTPFGLDLAPVQLRRYVPKRQAAEGGKGDISADADVRELQGAFFSTRANRFIWEVDRPHWHGAVPSLNFMVRSVEQLISSFRANGFVRMETWPGLDVSALRRELQQPQEDPHGGKTKSDSSPGGLIAQLARGYLQSEVDLHGSFRSIIQPYRQDYSNSPWHHDGCGKRLKAFIYLTDVDDHTPCTEIVAGTQSFHWYPTTHYFAGQQGHNKLNAEAVKKTFGESITRMSGKAGGGFIFDTNTIHAADMMDKSGLRDVVIVELSSVQHSQKMPRGPRGPDDGYLSSFDPLYCPSKNERGHVSSQALDEYLGA